MAQRVLFGHDGSGNFVLKVALPGIDVNLATDPNDFAFNSLLPEGAKLIMKGRTSAGARVNFGKTIWPPPLIVTYRDVSHNTFGAVEQAQVRKGLDSTGFTSSGFYMVFGYDG